jgi:hypothetical protein
LNRLLQLQCHPSAALSAAVLLIHAGALVCAWIALSPWIFAPVAVGLVLSCLAHWRQLRLRGAQSLCALDWREDALYLHFSGQPAHKSIFLSGAAPSPFWAVLRARDNADRQIDVLFAADAFDARVFRRLRVWLRWQPPGAGTGQK